MLKFCACPVTHVTVSTLSWFGSWPRLSETTDITWPLISLCAWLPLTVTYLFPLCRWMVSYWAFDMVNIGDKILKDPCSGLADWCLIFNLCSIAEHVCSRNWQAEVIYQHEVFEAVSLGFNVFVHITFRCVLSSVWIRKEERSSKFGSNLCASLCSQGCYGVHENSSVPFKLRKFCCAYRLM